MVYKGWIVQFLVHQSRRRRLLALLLLPPLLIVHWTLSHSLGIVKDSNRLDEQHSNLQQRPNNKQEWKEWLCSDQRPNMTAAAMTFRMAQQVFYNNKLLYTTHPTIVREFYSHWPGFIKLQYKNTTSIVLRTYKCGSMTLVSYIKDTLTPFLNSSRPTSSFQFNNFIKTHQGCIVTAVRDPIAHFISGLGEVEARHANITFTTAHYETLPIPSQERFIAFIDFLLRGNWFQNSHFYYQGKSWRNIVAHVLPQSGHLANLARFNKTITTFIHTKHIQTDFTNAMVNDCGLPQNIPPLVKTKTHDKIDGLNDFLQNLWHNYNHDAQLYRALQAVCLLNAIDYACLSEYLLHGPPEICKRTYETYLSTTIQI